MLQSDKILHLFSKWVYPGYCSHVLLYMYQFQCAIIQIRVLYWAISRYNSICGCDNIEQNESQTLSELVCYGLSMVMNIVYHIDCCFRNVCLTLMCHIMNFCWIVSIGCLWRLLINSKWFQRNHDICYHIVETLGMWLCWAHGWCCKQTILSTIVYTQSITRLPFFELCCLPWDHFAKCSTMNIILGRYSIVYVCNTPECILP